MEDHPTPEDIQAAERLQAIFADILDRPLTGEEKARCHEHVATVNAFFDKVRRHDPSGGA